MTMMQILDQWDAKTIDKAERDRLLAELKPKHGGFPDNTWGNATLSFDAAKGELVFRTKLDGRTLSKVKTDSKGKVTGGKSVMMCLAGGRYTIPSGPHKGIKCGFGVNVYADKDLVPGVHTAAATTVLPDEVK